MVGGVTHTLKVMYGLSPVLTVCDVSWSMMLYCDLPINSQTKVSIAIYGWKADLMFYAAVNGKLELTLLKGRQRFDTVSTSNLKV